MKVIIPDKYNAKNMSYVFSKMDSHICSELEAGIVRKFKNFEPTNYRSFYAPLLEGLFR